MPDFHVTFRDLLRGVDLRLGTDGFTFLWRKACWGFFRPEKSNGFGRVWTRELGYQRSATTSRPPKLLCLGLHESHIHGVCTQGEHWRTTIKCIQVGVHIKKLTWMMNHATVTVQLTNSLNTLWINELRSTQCTFFFYFFTEFTVNTHGCVRALPMSMWYFWHRITFGVRSNNTVPKPWDMLYIWAVESIDE